MLTLGHCERYLTLRLAIVFGDLKMRMAELAHELLQYSVEFLVQTSLVILGKFFLESFNQHSVHKAMGSL